MYTQDSTLDINLGLKSVYTVTVKLPDEPDLTNAELTYIYTNNEDGYVYQFNSAEDIRLRNGSYTLKLAGDFLAQPYSIKSGADVTVNGNEVSQTLGYELVTEWSFVYSDDGNYYKDTIMERQAITMDYILMQQAESLHQTGVHQIQHSLILELRYRFL